MVAALLDELLEPGVADPTPLLHGVERTEELDRSGPASFAKPLSGRPDPTWVGTTTHRVVECPFQHVRSDDSGEVAERPGAVRTRNRSDHEDVTPVERVHTVGRDSRRTERVGADHGQVDRREPAVPVHPVEASTGRG